MKMKTALLLFAVLAVNIFVLYPTYASPDTFGKTDVGSAEYSWGGNYILGCKFQLTNAGDVSKVTAYIASWGNIKVVAAIYNDVNGKVGNLKAKSNEVSVGDSFAWKDFVLSVSLEPGYYWVMLWSGSNIRYRYDNGEANQFVLHYNASYNNWPNPFPSANYYLNSEMSIYATYTPRPSNVATIRGTVTDSKTGNPIQGVNVTCDGMSTLTGSDGTYSFTVNLGSYTLTFSKEGYIDQIKYQDCPTQGEYIVNVLLQPVPTATIRGTLIDSQTGNPIEGVAVTCDGKSTSTALDGTYSFTVTLGSYNLAFKKTGYITENRTQNCPTEGEYFVDVSLSPAPTATIRGTVTDSKTGNPIQGVNVTCDGMSTLTASDGSYSFTVNLGSYTLIFSKTGYSTETKTQDCPIVGEYVVNMSLRLLTATIRGTITDSNTGAPIAEVNVTVDGTASTLTASDGTYSFTVNLGSHTLTFRKSGYVTETKTQNCPTEDEYIVNVSMSLLTATIFEDGFESGNFSAWDWKSGGPTVVTTAPYHGSYHMRANPLAWHDSYADKILSPYTTIYIRWYVRVGNLPPTDSFVNVGGLTNTGYNNICYVSYYNEGGSKYLRLSRWYPAALGTNYAWNYQKDTWYCFELKFVKSATVGEYRFWIDGVSIANQTGLDTSRCGTVGIVLMGVFKNTGYNNPNVYVDCVKVADTYIGEEPTDAGENSTLARALLYTGVLEYSVTKSNVNQPLENFVTPITVAGIIATSGTSFPNGGDAEKRKLYSKSDSFSA